MTYCHTWGYDLTRVFYFGADLTGADLTKGRFVYDSNIDRLSALHTGSKPCPQCNVTLGLSVFPLAKT